MCCRKAITYILIIEGPQALSPGRVSQQFVNHLKLKDDIFHVLKT